MGHSAGSGRGSRIKGKIEREGLGESVQAVCVTGGQGGLGGLVEAAHRCVSVCVWGGRNVAERKSGSNLLKGLATVSASFPIDFVNGKLKGKVTNSLAPYDGIIVDCNYFNKGVC